MIQNNSNNYEGQPTRSPQMPQMQGSHANSANLQRGMNIAPTTNENPMPKSTQSPQMQNNLPDPTAFPTGRPTGPATSPLPTPRPGMQRAPMMDAPPGEQSPLIMNSILYTPGYLQTQIGKLLRVEFLIGSSGPLVDRIGELLSVGVSYILIQPIGTDDVLLCDIYSIKFVTVYSSSFDLRRPI